MSGSGHPCSTKLVANTLTAPCLQMLGPQNLLSLSIHVRHSNTQDPPEVSQTFALHLLTLSAFLLPSLLISSSHLQNNPQAFTIECSNHEPCVAIFSTPLTMSKSNTCSRTRSKFSKIVNPCHAPYFSIE